MKISKQLKNQLLLLGCLALAASMAQAAQESDEVFPFDEVLHPQALSQAECEAKPMAAWCKAGLSDAQIQARLDGKAVVAK